MSRTFTPMPPWELHCPDCAWNVLVFPRGAHGRDQGSGYEAGMMLQRHREEAHGLAAALPSGEKKP